MPCGRTDTTRSRQVQTTHPEINGVPHPPPPNSPTSSESNEDRREYFRVEDRVLLRYRRIARDATSAQGSAEELFDDGEVFWLMRELRSVDAEHHSRLRGLADNNRELGLYLKALNRKIELIAAALSAFDRARHGIPEQTVTLSEAGLDFTTSEPLQVGEALAIQLVLLPEYLAVALWAEVVSFDADNGRVGVNFVRQRETDRQILARHALQVQIASRRQSAE